MDCARHATEGRGSHERIAPEDEPFEYVVQKGDNLSVIAQRFSVGLNLLRQLNQLKSDRIQPGQKLQLRPSSLDEAVHIVRPGENLSSIALKYKMKLEDLVRINGIEGSKILVGQKLRLKITPRTFIWWSAEIPSGKLQMRME